MIFQKIIYDYILMNFWKMNEILNKKNLLNVLNYKIDIKTTFW